MTRTIQQIKKELETIEEKVVILSEEVYKIYSKYLESLCESVRQQFILASYQICTQIYPENFLKLSYSQREKLQQELLKISQNDFQEIIDIDRNKLKITEPSQLAQWQEYLEDSIKLKLEEITKAGNNLLQKMEIFPEEIPAEVLEIAINTEENLPGISSPANLLYLLVESGKDETDNVGNIEKVTVICLRLSDLEFSSSTLTEQRGKIREISEQIRQLEQKYQKRQQELAIAEAEAAWRSSWHT